MVDAEGRPIALASPSAQAHDGRSAADLLETLGPCDILLAERAYDADWSQNRVAACGVWANMAPTPTRKRFPSFSLFLYRFQNLAERFFSTIKHFRAIATRCEKRAESDLVLVKLAAIQLWLRSRKSVT